MGIEGARLFGLSFLIMVIEGMGGVALVVFACITTIVVAVMIRIMRTTGWHQTEVNYE